VDGIGERIAAYRKRRGISQVALAGLIGRSESWLSQVERGLRGVDRLSVLLDIARVLRVDVESLIGESWRLAPNGGHAPDLLGGLRVAMTEYAGLTGQVPDVPRAPATAELGQAVAAVHRLYQAADYAAAAQALPDVIRAVDVAAGSHTPTESGEAHALRAWAYVAAGKLATKLADADLAWIAADRAAASAELTGSATLKAAAAYQVACAQLRRDDAEAAERIAVTTTRPFGGSPDPGLTSATGALWLMAAVTAARRTDRAEAQAHLNAATRLADHLRHDGNHAWTGFGPTNVAIHRVAVAAELGDASDTVRLATAVNTDRLPVGLASRKAQVQLNLAWAQGQRRRDPEAVLHLLEVERTAPQLLQHDVMIHELLRELLRRERRSATPALRNLAVRAGVLAS